MLYVAIAGVASSAVIAIVLGNLLRIVIRQGARERELLVNQVCRLSGKPWAAPPAWDSEEIDTAEELVLISSPEQFPDY